MKSTIALLSAIALSATVEAHVALWHPSGFGYDAPKQNAFPYTSTGREGAQFDSYQLNNPLRADAYHSESYWLGNNQRDKPPPPGIFLNVPTGNDLFVETTPNRAQSRWGFPELHQQQMEYKYANDYSGSLHTVQNFGDQINATLFGGSAFAIAYTSDVNNVKGADFTVISTNWISPYFRVTKFPIPSGLPPCPEGGCLCSWNWIHTAGNVRTEQIIPDKQPESEGYGSEMYNNLFRCQVTGETNANNVVPKGAVPTYCQDDIQKCTTGPKQPLYVYQVDGNNIPKEEGDTYGPPTHNWRYGFKNGAQQDAVVPVGQEATANGLGGGDGLSPADADRSEPPLDYDIRATVIGAPADWAGPQAPIPNGPQ